MIRVCWHWPPPSPKARLRECHSTCGGGVTEGRQRLTVVARSCVCLETQPRCDARRSESPYASVPCSRPPSAHIEALLAVLVLTINSFHSRCFTLCKTAKTQPTQVSTKLQIIFSRSPLSVLHHTCSEGEAQAVTMALRQCVAVALRQLSSSGAAPWQQHAAAALAQHASAAAGGAAVAVAPWRSSGGVAAPSALRRHASRPFTTTSQQQRQQRQQQQQQDDGDAERAKVRAVYLLLCVAERRLRPIRAPPPPPTTIHIHTTQTTTHHYTHTCAHTPPQLASKLLYRARQRGFLELDLLVGLWAEAAVPRMSAEQLREFATVLDEVRGRDDDDERESHCCAPLSPALCC